jgi:hypothetical protein
MRRKMIIFKIKKNSIFFTTYVFLKIKEKPKIGRKRRDNTRKKITKIAQSECLNMDFTFNKTRKRRNPVNFLVKKILFVRVSPNGRISGEGLFIENLVYYIWKV